jgi:hypothetical protein
MTSARPADSCNSVNHESKLGSSPASDMLRRSETIEAARSIRMDFKSLLIFENLTGLASRSIVLLIHRFAKKCVNAEQLVSSMLDLHGLMRLRLCQPSIPRNVSCGTIHPK